LLPAISDVFDPGASVVRVVEGMGADLEALGKHSNAELRQAVRAMLRVR
jgi:hypothetical protein